MQYWSQEGPKVPFTRLEFILDINLHYGKGEGQWLLTITNIHIFNDLDLNFPVALFFFLPIWSIGERIHLGASPSQRRVCCG